MSGIAIRSSAILLCLAVWGGAATAREVARPVPVVAGLVEAGLVEAGLVEAGLVEAGLVEAGLVVQVTDAAGLVAALGAATGGETIRLAPGDYGSLTLDAGRGAFRFDAPVTVTSDDPAAAAVLAGLNVKGAENIRFENLIFDYTWKDGDDRAFSAFRVGGSTNITIRGSTFDGDTAKGGDPGGIGYASGRGLLAGQNTNLDFIDNTMHGFWKGLAVGGNDNARVIGNTFHSMRSDGLNVNGPNGILIEGNYFHDFRRAPDSGDHADFIQFASTNATRPATDVTIRGNLFDIGKGGRTQTIFMRNDQVDKGLAGREMFFRRVLIEDNVIINAHLHGITLGETDGVVIRRNTLLRDLSPDVVRDKTTARTIPRIRVNTGSVNVTIEGNVAHDWPEAQPGWNVKGNLRVQDVSAAKPGFYEDLFMPRPPGRPAGLAARVPLMVRPGGAADMPGLGAGLMR